MKRSILLVLLLYTNSSYSLNLKLNDILANLVQIQAANNAQAVLFKTNGIQDIDANGNIYTTINSILIKRNLYSHDEQAILTNGSIGIIRVDQEGQLVNVLASTSSASISIINPDTAEELVIASGLAITELSTIAIDINNDVLIGGRDADFKYALFRFNLNTRVFETIVFDDRNQTGHGFLGKIELILIDQDGNYLLRDWQNIFHKVDRHTGERTLLFPERMVFDIHGNEIGLRLDKFSPNGFIDDQNKLVIYNQPITGQSALGSGLIKIDLDTKIAETLELQNMEPDHLGASFIYTPHNTLLLQTFSFQNIGISEFDLNTLDYTQIKDYFSFKHNEGLKDIKAVEIINERKIIYSSGSNIVDVDTQTGKNTTIAEGGLLDGVMALQIDQNGMIYALNSQTIVQVNPNDGSQRALTLLPENTFAKDITLDNDNNLFILHSFSQNNDSCITKVNLQTSETQSITTTDRLPPCFIGVGTSASIHFDSFENDLILADTARLFRLDLDIDSVTIIAERGNIQDTTKFYEIADITTAPDGSIYVLNENSLNNSIFRINPFSGAQERIAVGGLLNFDFRRGINCKCLSVVGGVEKTTIDIRANGTNKSIILNEGQEVTVTVSLIPGVDTSNRKDWWVAATSPFGLFWLTSDLQWVLSETPIRTLESPVFPISDFPILNNTVLPKGGYTIYFGIDDNADNRLDASNIGSVNINIE